MKKKVIMFPDWRTANPYQDLLASGLNKNGVDCTFLGFKKNKVLTINASLKGVKKPDIIHIHWINQYIESISWGSNYFILSIKFFLIFLDLLLLRMKGIKLVWTVHNLFSHESNNKTRELIARMIFARLCNIVVHSEGARQLVAKTYRISKDKITVIPHGSYIGCYEHENSITATLKNNFDIAPNDIVFLFLGHIRRYKGVEQLVNAFSETSNVNYKLVIAGKPKDEDDAKWLNKMAGKDSRIRLSLGFVPDNEICSYLELSSTVVLPYINTLTSGAAILAMSFGKALILPEKSKIFNLPDDGVIYYSEEQGIVSAFSMAEEADLNIMGNINLSYCHRMSWDFVTSKLARNVYN